ncbi:MAG TPA: site-2 protease family protein [Anaeromyxobacter sp.]|nr:site-2 protease family protein [Anaeromyxobacter sp.]
MADVLVRTEPRSPFPTANVLLFLATVATTLWMGFQLSPVPAPDLTVGNVVRGGFPFAGSLVAILFTHEMGHYVLARRYGVRATLPYFIPVPFGVGTLGAVIRMRSPIPSRRATLDIGAAGPLAGLAVALPLLLVGFSLSEVREVGAAAATTASPLQSPFTLVRALLAHEPLRGASGGIEVFGDSALTWAAGRLVFGSLPAGHDVFLHPIALAAWLGLLVTTLNLVPLGQLDGGHVLYALLGRRRARLVGRAVSAGLLAAGIFWTWSWLVWWALSRFVIGLGHPPALAEEPLGPGRRAIAWLSLALFVLTFVPVPVSF